MPETSERPAFTEAELKDQNKVVSLFQFIRELNILKRKAILDYREYPWAFELAKLPDDPENIRIAYRDRVEEEEIPDPEYDAGDVLLSVHKPEFQQHPYPGAAFADWLLPGWDDFHQEAEVREQIQLGDEDTADELPPPLPLLFTDDEGRVRVYEAWKKERDAWAADQCRIEKTRNLFADLYRMYFELQRESETEEIIVANGILCDRDNPEIRHPLLTHRVKLEYDADINTVSIVDTAVPSELYSIVLQSLSDINLSGINALSEELQKNDYHPLDRNDTPIFLKALVHQLSSDSIFSEKGIPAGWSKDNRLLLYREPCYIVRKRLDGTLKAIEQIIENVQDAGEIPAPIRDLVSGGTIEIPEDTGSESVEEQLAAVGGESVDIILSKEANKEQLEIARRIEFYNAVLVQGPPGTGKTHTIANLMGHFLAQGKSVLVTSHTTKALSVLKGKVDPALQNLCVSILDDSNLDMERSIDGITSYMSKTTSHELKRDMELLAVERQDIINQLADVRRKIFAIIRQECESLVYNGEGISPSKAAAFVVENADTLSYIPGKVRIPAPLPLTFEQLIDLYRSNEGLSPEDEEELSHDLPATIELLSPQEFETLHSDLQEMENRFREISGRNGLSITHYPNDRQLHVEGEFGQFDLDYPEESQVESLKNYVHSFGKIEKWMKVAAVDGRHEDAFRQRWQTLIRQIEKVCRFAEQVLSEQFGLDIQFRNPEQKEGLKNTFEQLKEAFEIKGKIGKLTLMLHKDYGVALESVTINGNPPQSAKDCEVILHTIELESMRKQCATYWDTLLAEHDVPKFFDLDRSNQERIAKNWIPQLQRYLDWYRTDYQPLLEQMEGMGIPEEVIFARNALDSDLTATDRILSAAAEVLPVVCDACLAVLKMNACRKEIDYTRKELLSGKRGSSRICSAILDAIEQGNPEAYADSYAELNQMYSKYILQGKRQELLLAMEPIAPHWAEAIRERRGVHGQFAVPDDIEDAWKWKQLKGMVDELTGKPFRDLQTDSVRLGKEYREATARYAEKSAWYHLLRRTEADLDMRKALQGWKQTVKKIGKGTGKRAPALKAEARRLMVQCQNAVPAWIMPINRALESLNPKYNRFDVIIIDEASQSDISSLSILYMGRKLIIVGDDKQVSPLAVGIEVDKISALQEMYIKDKIPLAQLYTPQTSIYDISATTFQPLMLREHFRCVPEIIGFSNMLSYDHKIKPLRDASNSILLPAVVNYRVDGGKREEGTKTNLAEANAIISLMKACMEQPEYKGKTMGVISLLGDEQVKVIQRLIEQEIDPREIIGRKILCGNSANFQGDERDVIFLSLVDSGRESGPLALSGFGVGDATRKRYNVAASRARDQLWVVDSLDPTTDLKPGDIRKTLIEYSINPHAADIVKDEQEAQAESPFEAAVVADLTDRGFHLIQQWQVGAYRLDMVAICGNKTVAIECDGERWHSGEAQIRMDMERQTILERLGWRFIRIRGSEYYRRPQETIDRVVKELEAYGIHPEEAEETSAETRETELLQRVKRAAGQ